MQKQIRNVEHAMTRRHFLRSAAAGAAAAGLPSFFPDAFAQGRRAQDGHQMKRPNIVFFFVDDLGWEDTSVPFGKEKTELNERYRTPSMEKLAREGVKFTRAYAAAICSPTRNSIMSGQNSARHRVTTWTRDLNQIPDSRGEGRPLVPPDDWNFNALQPKGTSLNNSFEAETLPSLLSEAGYRTIHVGKAHLGTNGSPGECPTSIGFDDNVSGYGSGGLGSYYGTENFGNEFGEHTPPWGVPDLEHLHGKDIFLTEAHTREALKLVEDAVSRDQPFFLHMSHYAVHTPLMLDERFADNYPELSGNILKYATMVEGMDKSLGDILQRIEELGIENDTIIIFYSDNGVLTRAVPGHYTLRGGKGTGYEGGIRVPMLIKWPRTATPSSTCAVNVISEDFYPTILSMAGVRIPDSYKARVDGRDITPLLTNEEAFDIDRPIFFHQPHYHNGTPYSAVIKGRWKLIYWHEQSRVVLFDLKTDIGEENDLSDQNTEKADELKRLLGNHLRNVDAQMPTIKSTGRKVPYPD